MFPFQEDNGVYAWDVISKIHLDVFLLSVHQFLFACLQSSSPGQVSCKIALLSSGLGPIFVLHSYYCVREAHKSKGLLIFNPATFFLSFIHSICFSAMGLVPSPHCLKGQWGDILGSHFGLQKMLKIFSIDLAFLRHTRVGLDFCFKLDDCMT